MTSKPPNYSENILTGYSENILPDNLQNNLTCGNIHAKMDVWQQERRMMDEQELASLLRSHGWSYIRRLRRKGTPYAYARKREGASIKERYLTPISRISRLTSEEVINKLQLGDEPNVAAAIECYIPTKVCCHSIA